MNENKLLSVIQFAKLKNLSRTRIYQFIEAERLEHVLIANHYFIKSGTSIKRVKRSGKQFSI